MLGDAQLAVLARLPALRALCLAETGATDASAAVLTALPGLQVGAAVCLRACLPACPPGRPQAHSPRAVCNF